MIDYGIKYALTTSQIEYIIDEWIFDKKQREIIKRRIIDGEHYEPLAEDLKMSVRRVQAIVAKGEEKIAAHADEVRDGRLVATRRIYQVCTASPTI